MNTFHICNCVCILIYKKCVLIILNKCNALFFWHRFYDTWIIIIALTRIHHRFPSWTVWIVHTLTHCFSNMCCNIIITSTPESPLTEGSVAAVIIHFASPSILAACPVHLIRDQRKNILWSVKIMKILIMQFFTFSSFLPLVSQYLQYPVPNDPHCVCFPSLLLDFGRWSPVSHCGGLCAIRERPFGVCGGQSGTGIGFSVSTSVSHITLMHSCVWKTGIGFIRSWSSNRQCVILLHE